MEMFSNFLLVLFFCFFATSQSTECGGKIKERFGTIQSPAFPKPLPGNLNCTWTITGSNANDVVQLEINGFDINDTESDACSKTYLEISNYGQPGIRFCNNQPPPVDLISTTNEVKIILVTSAGSHNDSKGFLLNFKIFDKGNITTTITPTITPTISPKNCGGNFNKTIGRINSPNFPKAYESNLSCIWIISGGNVNDYVELEFNLIDIDDNSSKVCANNYISFGDTKSGKSLPRYCNQNRPPNLEFVSHTQQIVIRFVTDSKNQTSSGFDMVYRIYSGTMPTGSILTTTPSGGHQDKSHSTSHVARDVVISIIVVIMVMFIAYDLYKCRYGRGVCYKLFHNRKGRKSQKLYSEL